MEKLKNRGKKLIDKPIALVFSDIHLNIWKEHNRDLCRTHVGFDIMEKVLRLGYKDGIPVLFAGDLLHNPHHISNKLLSIIFEKFKTWENLGYHMYAIDGNHDQSDDSSYLESFSIGFPNLITLVNDKLITTDKINIAGVPHIKGNVLLREKINKLNSSIGNDKPTITLIHTDLPGASDYNGFSQSTVDNIGSSVNNLYKGNGLIISGHIHKFQKLSNNVYMVGSTNEQRTSDAGGDFGYITIDSKLKVKHIIIKSPGFKFYSDTPGDDVNYWVKVPRDTNVGINVHNQDNIISHTNTRIGLVDSYIRKHGVKQKGRIKLLKKFIDGE